MSYLGEHLEEVCGDLAAQLNLEGASTFTWRGELFPISLAPQVILQTVEDTPSALRIFPYTHLRHSYQKLTGKPIDPLIVHLFDQESC